MFNNIRSFMQKEVNAVIANHLTNKNYNVNDAQIWTNQICDDVPIYSLRSSRVSPLSTRTLSSLLTASSCRKLTAVSIFLDPVSGTMKSTAPSLSNGTPPPLSASSMSSDAPSDSALSSLYHRQTIHIKPTSGNFIFCLIQSPLTLTSL